MERKWVKKQNFHKNFEVIRAKHFDDYKDFVMDHGCYLLIKIYRDTHEIGVAVCDYKHIILKEFRGRRAQDIYNTIFEYSLKKKKKWFTRLEHAAYLGKELKKAEMALALGTNYVQD